MEGLQGQLVEFAVKNTEMTQRLATVEAAKTVTPNPQQVLMPSTIDTRLLKQPAASDGDNEMGQTARNCVLATRVKDEAMKKIRNALVGHVNES